MVNIAIIFAPGTAREEVIAAVEAHFANPGANGTQTRQSVVTAPAPAQLYGSMPMPGAPSNVPAAPPASVQQIELDADGIPWDERIHSGSKGKNKDGTWTKRRNVDEKLVKKVTKELEALMEASPSAGGPPPLGVTAGENTPIPAETMAAIERGDTVALTPQQVEFLKKQEAAAPHHTAHHQTTPPPSMPLPGQSLPPPLPGASTPPPPPSPQDLAYAAFVARITRNIRTDANQTGMLTNEWVSQVLSHYGVKDQDGNGSLSLLSKRPDLVPVLDAYLTSVNVPA